MVDIGYISLFLALVAAIYAAVAFGVGRRQGNAALVHSARNGVIAVAALVTVSVGSLLYAILSHDFQISYVASYTDTDMSMSYLISALWAGNSGSLLFWGWLLAVMSVVAVFQKRDRGKELVPYAGMVLMITAAFFIGVLLMTSNPFSRLPYVPVEGRGLNPLLENPGMLFHPPTLLGGYVAFTVPFAFAIAALLTRRLGDEWLVVVRRWTLVAWMLLGIGNVLGAWWAYVELGWGGFWAWDPVENASFMPWLMATAFLHSIMMQRRRGMLKIWNMTLIILTFALTILGTFLTRSGVISSVHTFAASPLLGTLFLSFIGFSLFISFGLLWYRSEDLRSDAQMESLLSRESTFLVNNLLLVGATLAVLLGTFFPVISEAVRGVKITVGPPFFNQVNGPIFLAVILLAGVCTLIGWRRASRKNLVKNFLWPAVAAVAIGAVLIAVGVRQWYAIVGFVVLAFVMGTILYEWVRGTLARHRIRGDNYLASFWGLILANRPRYGGYIVHIGIVLLAMGVIGSTFFDVQRDVQLRPGESMTINSYTLRFDSLDSYETASREIVTATMIVYKDLRRVGTMTPEKYFHRSYEQAVTEVAIRSTVFEDLYVILINWEEDGSTASFRVLVNPLVSWLWYGGWIVLVGGMIAFWPERRRAPGHGVSVSRRRRDEVEAAV